jgi:hypothetical protein
MHEQLELPFTAYHLLIVDILVSVFDILNKQGSLLYWGDCLLTSQPSLLDNYYFVLLSEFWEWQSDVLLVECSRYFKDSGMFTFQIS